MIGLEDRQTLVQHLETAHAARARLRPLQRWKAKDALHLGERRPLAKRARPAHALSGEEQAQILALANAPRFTDQPPARIVPALASGRPWDWAPVGAVTLNPERDDVVRKHTLAEYIGQSIT